VAVVVDASAMVEMLLGTPAGEQAREQLRGAVAACPAHLDAEVLSALGRLVRDRTLEAATMPARLAALARAPLARYPLPPLLAEAWSLRSNLALRDALYVSLARRLTATLLSADRRLARPPGLGVPVILVGE
jgi:predicted nucleic acid-binding protein